MSKYATFLIILLLSLFNKGSSLDPINQIQLYPNTENSVSMYIFSFKLSKNVPAKSYILITMDWYSSSLKPYDCIFVNTTIKIQCTNFLAPTFPLLITQQQLLLHNQYFNSDKTVAIQLGNNILTANTQYFLQIHFYNVIPNVEKISPSAEIYIVSKDGLVYQENINYGSTINRPPITNQLFTSILNPLISNKPGKLDTFKAQFMISQAIQTSLSAFTLILYSPFSFSLGSIPTAQASQLSATNNIPLYAKPQIFQYQIISPNIFYVVFNQSFVAGRRFILSITQIQNPFFLASSNFSIYSLNYHSLTPLEAYQNNYPIATVTYDLTVSIGLPYDVPQIDSMTFYRNIQQYIKVRLTIPQTVPQGYSIKILYTSGTGAIISTGTAYANFQNVNYDPEYVYGTNFFIISGMGQILVGTQIDITFQVWKDNINTLFYIYAYIDTEAVIAAGAATNYMYYGSNSASTISKSRVFNNVRDGYVWQSFKISTYYSSSNTYVQFTTYNYEITSSGSYIDIYLSPSFQFDSDFNPNSDCRLNNTAGSAICTTTVTPSYIKITVKATAWYTANVVANMFTRYTYLNIYIWNLWATKTSSYINIYPCYFTLYQSDVVNPVKYYDYKIITAVPRYNQLTNVIFQHYGDISHSVSKFNYPGFNRIQCTDPSKMNYVIQQNQQRVIVITSAWGFRGMGTIKSQDPYPCTSNIDVSCQYRIGRLDTCNNCRQLTLEWDKIIVKFPSKTQNTTNFHVIIPDAGNINLGFYYQYFMLIGTYNKLTKDFNLIHSTSQELRLGWNTSPTFQNSSLSVDMQGKAGSYRKNVTVNIWNQVSYTSLYTFLGICTSWQFWQKGMSSLTSSTLGMSNPTFGGGQKSPLSVYLGGGMYLTAIPLRYSSSLLQYSITLDNVHMPYHYDLPDYYIFTYQSNSRRMASSNQFIMTNANVFYVSPLKSLTISCLSNALGVQNTICTIVFGTQHPLKADGKIRIVFSGMTVATDVCQVLHTNLTSLPVTCSSTSDNKNVTISMSGWQQYPAGTFTVIVNGIGIPADQISQSFVLYLYDSTGNYAIEQGTRILTTTILPEKVIEVYQILYNYNSPLSYNKMTIKFYLPRKIYSDQQFGFLLGKDLSDVNTQIKRLNIILTRSDGVILDCLFTLISTQYKVMFTFQDPSLLIESNYTLQIYGIQTPASHLNGQFKIIFQRKYDLAFSLINQISTSFPELGDYIISDMTLKAYYNTQGYDQQIDVIIKNQQLSVDDQIIWIVNFPSYYSPLIFNYDPYCLIDGAPITCYVDQNTPYQIFIVKSPKIIAAGTYYTISILGIACPRAKYTDDKFPNRYIFIGVLENSEATKYSQTSLLYPYQDIQSGVNGIIGISDIQVTSTQLTSFYTTFITIVLKCNVAISTNNYLYLDFPGVFDNFNNNPLNYILSFSASNIIGTNMATVLDRRVEILIPSNIPANTILNVQFTNMPTPTQQVSVQMSQIISYVTPNNKLTILAASATSGNSAPKITFTKDTRYLSFNDDNQVVITAGTYSQPIKIASSDGTAFLTNVVVNVSSTGFAFEPASILLSLGDYSGEFIIGADQGLYPISYFYSAVKTQQVTQFYKITANNNIRVTNIPVKINIPTSIDLPKGGCSSPFLVYLTNTPTIDLKVSFTYDNFQYGEDEFFPNPKTTNSLLTFNKSLNNNTVSFCSSASIIGTQFPLTMVLSGTNYASYQFQPSNVITVNIVSRTLAAPTISLQMINQQKTFIDFNLTVNMNGFMYYWLTIGNNIPSKTAQQIQVQLKTGKSVLKSMSDYMSHLYLTDRDSRVGQGRITAGQTTLRFNDMLPQTYYTFCTYIENQMAAVSNVRCISVQTQTWGSTYKAYVTFSKTVSQFQLNKAICFFTKNVGTNPQYLIDIQGNSCNDNQVKNTNFLYPGTIFTNQHKSTMIYLMTNPRLTSDPSPTSFMTMFNTNKTITSTSLSAALSQYGIDYMPSVTFIKQQDTRTMSYQAQANNLLVSYSQPKYRSNLGTVTISNIRMSGVGSVYFLLVLYKQIIVQPNGTTVNIRLNVPPTQEQLLNCVTWQNIAADGCARAVYSGTSVQISFSGIQPNSMYWLYYAAAAQYPLRPVISSTISSQTIVTYSFAAKLKSILGATLILLVMLTFVSP